jgi:flotillin
MRVKAAAYHEYNQAAVLDKVITNLPEMVRALAEPLSKVDKISIVSTGSGANGNLGASRVTGDMVNMLAQTPAILEALTGVRLADLMARVPGLTVESDGANNAAKPAAATDTAPSDEAPAPAKEEQPVTGGSTGPTIPSGISGLNGSGPASARGPHREHIR